MKRVLTDLYQCSRDYFGFNIYFFGIFLATFCSELWWHWRYYDGISLFFACSSGVLFGLFILLGKLWLEWIAPSFNRNMAIQFTCGFLIFNTVLYGLTFATKFSLFQNACLIAGFTLFAAGLKRKSLMSNKGDMPSLLCFIICGMGAGIWCSDALSKPLVEGSNTVFPVWSDAFIHVRHISQFAYSSGYQSISNIEMAQETTPAYHYAMFFTPALLVSAGCMDSYGAYVSFFLPFGLFLTGLAAFSVVSLFFGEWPALAATAAIMICPDAYQQGFGTKFFSYYFLQMVCPGGLYGIACLTIAWMFILEAGREGSIKFLGIGYIFVVLTLFYRAHFFFANAFIALVYPCFNFKGLSMRFRLWMFTILSLGFVTVLSALPKIPVIPAMRLSFNTTQQWADFVLSNFDHTATQGLYALLLKSEPGITTPLFLPVLLLFSTFGFWILLWFLMAKNIERKDVFLFVFVIVANYLVMGSYLELDNGGVHEAEELLHRPFVWAYFIAVALPVGAVYHFHFGNSYPKNRTAQAAFILGALLLALVSFINAKNIQTMPLWPQMANYQVMSSVPNGLVDISAYIRNHGSIHDVVQDSENDTYLKITALTERQDFAIKSINVKERSPALNKRLDELVKFKDMSNIGDIGDYVRKHQIDWVIIEPISKVAWPAAIDRFCVLKSRDYLLYKFPADDSPSSP